MRGRSGCARRGGRHMGSGNSGAGRGGVRGLFTRRRHGRVGRSPLRCESLEDRTTPTVWWVTSTADSGAGTIRGALAAAHSGDTINFDPSLLYATINLTSGELLVNKSLTINGPTDQNGQVVADGVVLQNAWN